MKELEPRVFVVDDDQSVRTSLATLLSAEDYAVESFASAAEYLAHPPHRGPACLVLDVQLPGLDGIAFQQQLTQKSRMEQDCLHHRAWRYPDGDRDSENEGRSIFCQSRSATAKALARSAENQRQRSEVVESRARLTKLTPREFEVLRLVIAGLLNKQIAAKLGITLRTTKTHRARVMQKMGVNSVAELVRLAEKAGVVPVPHGPKRP
jgi:FixJ family two-component response regulator